MLMCFCSCHSRSGEFPHGLAVGSRLARRFWPAPALSSAQRGGNIVRQTGQQAGLGGDHGLVAVGLERLSADEGAGRLELAIGQRIGTPASFEHGMAIGSPVELADI